MKNVNKTYVLFSLLGLLSCSEEAPLQEKQEEIDITESIITNHIPIANSGLLETIEGTDGEITLTATDEDGDTLEYIITKQPEHGKVTANQSQVTYTPDIYYFGEDSFTYTASDGTNTSNEAKVDIKVASSESDEHKSNIATWDTTKNHSIYMSFSDIYVCDLSNHKFELALYPKHGTIYGENGDYFYIPNDDFVGYDTLNVVCIDTENDETDYVYYNQIVIRDETEVEEVKACGDYEISSPSTPIVYGQVSYQWTKKSLARRVLVTALKSDGSVYKYTYTNDNGCYSFTYEGENPIASIKVTPFSKASSNSPDDIGDNSCDGASWNVQVYGQADDTTTTSWGNLAYTYNLVASENLAIEANIDSSSFVFENNTQGIYLYNKAFHALDIIIEGYELVCQGAPSTDFLKLQVYLATQHISDVSYYDSDIKTIIMMPDSFYVSETEKNGYQQWETICIGHELTHYLENVIYKIDRDRNYLISRTKNSKHDSTHSLDPRFSFHEGLADGFGRYLSSRYTYSIDNIGGSSFNYFVPNYNGQGITNEKNVEYVISQLLGNDGYKTIHQVLIEDMPHAKAFMTLHSFGYYYSLHYFSDILRSSFEEIGVNATSLNYLYDEHNLIGRGLGNEYALYPTVVVFPYYVWGLTAASEYGSVDISTMANNYCSYTSPGHESFMFCTSEPTYYGYFYSYDLLDDMSFTEDPDSACFTSYETDGDNWMDACRTDCDCGPEDGEDVCVIFNIKIPVESETTIDAECVEAFKQASLKTIDSEFDGYNYWVLRSLNSDDADSQFDHYFYSSSEAMEYYTATHTDEDMWAMTFFGDETTSLAIEALLNSYLLSGYDNLDHDYISHEYPDNLMASSGASRYYKVDGSLYPYVYQDYAYKVTEDGSWIENIDFNPNFHIASDDAGSGVDDPCGHVITLQVWEISDTGIEPYGNPITGVCPEIIDMPDAEVIIEVSSEEDVVWYTFMENNFYR